MTKKTAPTRVSLFELSELTGVPYSSLRLTALHKPTLLPSKQLVPGGKRWVNLAELRDASPWLWEQAVKSISEADHEDGDAA